MSEMHSHLIIYGIAILTALHRSFGSPIEPPGITQCRALHSSVNCSCPPNSPTIIDFRPPPPSTTVRIRRAAHSLDADYIRKYINATTLMKQLDPGHPWNFIQQANIHCAYCEGAYNQSGHPVELQVHGSWLFYPFHRAYLYFYERILGKLIGDDTFALPFWNWDSPAGMTIPAVYADNASSLYDAFRDESHKPPAVVDFELFGADQPIGRDKMIDKNLRIMYRQMVQGGKTAELFLGRPYRAGDAPFPGGGTLEGIPHGSVHVWTGGQGIGEHMSSFDTAGRDPIFFAHHANVDRMWKIWKGLPGGDRRDFNDTDWLDSGFLFYDENERLVRIRVRDLLDTQGLGYAYESVPVPWLNTTAALKAIVRTAVPVTRVVDYPMPLDSPVSVEVGRPGGEKTTEEVLVVDGIEVEMGADARFDVYINSAAAEGEVMAREVAGSFVHLAMKRRRGVMMRTRLTLGLADLLENIGASRDDGVVVTLVPRTDNGNITVGGIRIEFHA